MFTDFNKVTAKEIIPGFSARFIHTESNTLSLVEVDEGAFLPSHSHVHEQVSHILEGEFELTVNGITKICKKGDIATIRSNEEHSGRAWTYCKILDIFTPVREDYK